MKKFRNDDHQVMFEFVTKTKLVNGQNVNYVGRVRDKRKLLDSNFEQALEKGIREYLGLITRKLEFKHRP